MDPKTGEKTVIVLPREQQIAFGGEALGAIDDFTVCHHLETGGGSSGAPIFDDDGKLYALHHGGCPEHENCKIGIRTDAIVQYLKDQVNRRVDFKEKWLADALKSSCTSQSTISFFDIEKNGSTNLKAPHPHFVGRKELLGQLEETLILKEWKSNQATIVRALFGPGGIGKSETAIIFADSHLDEYSIVWWIDAETEEGQERNYRELADVLHLDIEKDSPEAICGKVHTCLLQKNFEKPWLLIFDNVENPIEIPQRGGVVLVTIRDKQLFPQPQRIEVKPFDHEDAIELFVRITNEEKTEEMESLLESLGDYPLVLMQAASYIAETPGMTVKKYLEKRQEGSSSTRLQKDDRYPKTLSETLETTLELLQVKDPRAVRWLDICAYLSPEGIDLSYLDHWLKEMCKEGDTEKRERHSEEILRLLTRYSLFRFDGKTKLLSIHRSIREVLRDRKDQGNQWKIFQEAFSLILKRTSSLDFDNKINTDWQRIMKQAKQWEPHALALLKSPFFNVIERIYQPFLFSKIGKIKEESWNFQGALKIYQQALKSQEASLYEKHPNIACTLIDIGNSLESLGRNEEALEHYCQALEIREETLGEKHPDVAHTLTNMGVSLRSLDRREEALRCYRGALEIQKEKLGRKHPDVATTLTNMGVSLYRLGNNEKALEHYRKALEIQKETLGEKHPDVAHTLTNMGVSLYGLGCNEEAMEHYREALEIQKEKLGENHPMVALTLTNMGVIPKPNCFLTF